MSSVDFTVEYDGAHQSWYVGIATTDADGAASDPTTVEAIVRNPANGNETTYTYGTDAELTKAETGSYQLLFTPTAEHPDNPVDWWLEVRTTSTVGGLTVKASRKGVFKINQDTPITS